MRFQPIDNRREGRIVQDHPVFGVIDDVDQLLVEQPDVERVDHPAKADCAVPRRQMTVMVHRKGRHTVAGVQAHRGKCLCQFAGIARNPGPVGAFDHPVGPTCHDFSRTAFARGMIDQVGDA